MLNMHNLTMKGALVGSMLMFAACTGEAGEAVDNTVAEPSLDTRVQLIATEACERFEECGNIGEGDGNAYETMEECRTEMEGDFYDLWPQDECSDGRVDATKYDSCLMRAETYSCDDNIFDFIAYYSECNADDVCTDPAQ